MCVYMCVCRAETDLICNLFISVNAAMSILHAEMRSMHCIFVILRNDKYNYVTITLFCMENYIKINTYTSSVTMCLTSSELRLYNLKSVKCSSTFSVCGIKSYTVKQVIFVILVP